MPHLSVLMIRAALLYLAGGFFFGGLMLFNKGIPFEGMIWRLLPVHVEMLIFGWMLQLAMGVAFWIVPRFSTEPRYGRVWLVKIAFVLLNVGVWLSAFSQWDMSMSAAPLTLLIGRVSMLLSGICFIVHIAPRIKPLSFSTT